MVGSVAARPAWAQQAAHQRLRIALAAFSVPAPLIADKGNNPAWRAMYLELRRLGYIEGENLIVDRFSAEGQAERLGDMAREIVKRHPDVILSEGNGIARALAAATTTIPIVSWMGDPIAFRLVASLARPDGNITGISVDAGWELAAKQLEILKEIVPSATKIAYMNLRANLLPDRPDIKFRREAERKLNIEAIDFLFNEPTPTEYNRLFAAAARQKVDALSVGPSAELFTERLLIIDLANEYRLPASYWYPECVTDGGLMSYGPDLTGLSRHVARQVHQILSGSKVSDVPVYQPERFPFFLNLKTAEALGLTVPRMLLARADKVIE